MPLTPFHTAVAILGFIWFEKFYLPALVISSVLMDLEPFYYMFIATNPPYLHGFWHTYLGATIIALVVAFLLIKFRKQVDSITKIFKAEQKQISTKWIYASSIIAAWSHILLDSTMHGDMKPLWPITDANPFLNLIHFTDLYLTLGLILFAVVILFVQRFVKQIGSEIF